MSPQDKPRRGASPLSLLAIAAYALVAISVLATVTLTAAEASAEPASIRRFALIVGANDGGRSRVKLRYANTDARRFSRVLRTFGGVMGKDLVVLREADPQGIRAAFERLNMRIAQARRSHRRVELIIYYSGHSDETGLLPSGRRMSWAELRHELKGTPADVRIAILDSCASGSLIRGKGGIRRAPFLMDESSEVKGHAYLTSSSANEVAQESDRIGASYFTHHLVTGLRGAADVNNDRRVTLSEAYQYAFHQTLARTEKTRKGPQHPNYDFELAGSGDIVITALGAMASTMLFEKAIGGRFFIRDARGRLVAELEKIPGRRIELGLDPGRYRVNLHQNDRVFTTEITLRRGRRSALESDTFIQTKNREITRSRGTHRPDTEFPPMAGSLHAPAGPSVLLNVQLVPGLSLLGAPANAHVRKLSLNILGGLNDSVSGVEAATIFNMETGGVYGGQYAGVFNMVGGDFDGIQASGSFNTVRGGFKGVQAAGAVNVIGGDLKGVQAGGAASITGGHVHGGQFTGAVNIAGDGVKGVQAAVVNIAGGDSDGGQFGVVNIGGRLDGVQAAVVNVADDIHGVQAGVVNVADDSKGLQVGLVNVATGGDGRAIGLLNFVKGGWNRVEAWTSDTSALNVGIKFGSQWMYTIAALGISEEPDQRAMNFSLGWGTHFALGRWWLDIDGLSGVAIEDEARMKKRVDLLAKARITLGRTLGKRFAVFGGVAMNVAVGFDGRAPRELPMGTWRECRLGHQTCVAFGPGAFAGVSL